MLVEVARRLQAAAEGAFLARIGGDEFMLIVADGAQAAAAATLADRLLATLVHDIDAECHRIKLGMSINVAVYPTDGTDAKTLMINADAALYRAKAETRGAAMFFEPEMSERLTKRRELQEDLRSAIDRDESGWILLRRRRTSPPLQWPTIPPPRTRAGQPSSLNWKASMPP